MGLQKKAATLFVHGIIPLKTHWPSAGRGLQCSVACIFQPLNSLCCLILFFLRNPTPTVIFLNKAELPSHIINPIENLSYKLKISYFCILLALLHPVVAEENCVLLQKCSCTRFYVLGSRYFFRHGWGVLILIVSKVLVVIKCHLPV